jgi:hypothetical protein
MVIFCHEFLLELLHSTLSLVDKPANVACHPGKLLGSKEHQEEQPYDYHL